MELDHVGIACADLEAEIARYRAAFGAEVAHREVVASQGVEEAMLPFGGAFVQLLRPLAPDTPVGRFLADRGPGMHHVAFRVNDVAAALDRLRADGARLVDEEPRPGSRGTRIAFVHPKSMGGVLVELVEHPRA